MNYVNMLLKSFKVESIDRLMVSSLYSLSQRSIIATIFLSLLLTYYLYPVLSYSIVLWNVIVVFVSFVRLYLAHYFHKDQEKYTLKTWYFIFVFSAFSSAFLFSVLGFIAIFYVDEVQQIFIIAVLLGFTSGAMSSLFPDVRIVVGYISIILLPLIAVLTTLGTTLHILLFLLVILYFGMLIIVVLNAFKQSIDIEQERGDIYKEQQELLKKEEALDYFFEQAPVGIFSYDMELNVTDCNQSFLNLFGLTKNEIMKRNLADLPDSRPLPAIRSGLVSYNNYAGPYMSIKGYELWVEAQCFPVHNYYKDIVGGICIIEDKTKEHQAVEDLNHLASHDPLTSLLNRRGLKEHVSEFMKKEEHKNFYSLLVYLDLNKFKNINDSLGHKAGDKLLIAISNRLKLFVKDSCVVSRFGGDEFIVVSPFVADNIEGTEQEGGDCTERIQKAFTDPFNIDDMKLSITTSLGIVVIEPNISNIDEIIRYADIAMYQAKKGSSDHISYYDTSLDQERKKIFTLQHDMPYASGKGELKIYLQPLVTMKDHNLFAAESLLRWDHPELGFLSPNEFIPIAIETGLISEITWWLIEEICKYISALKEKGLWKLNYISVNVNAKQLLLNHFVNEFLSILSKYKLNNADIMIEITERSIIDNFEDTQDVINNLQKEGIKCAIDDFGIGYSSLSYLKKLSFDTLKIDMEFIKDIKDRPDDITLVKTLLAIGKQFNYHIVVEGIEDEKQKELLLEIDEDLVYQGFLFSKPIPYDIFTEKYLS